jgi:hypothetical protein
MNSPFKLLRSHKFGLDGSENYVVARDDVAYLRIVGGRPFWTVMTATADEDDGAIRACPEQLRLREAAIRLGTELKVTPGEGQDWLARQYVVICQLNLSDRPDESLADQAELNDLCTRFFETYDLLTSSENARDEMRDLYTALTNSHGGDVYLSDGIWLSSDGSMQDRGR